MVEVDADSARVALHVLAVSVWIGGQLIMAALVPVLRAAGPDVPRQAAQRFGRVAWPFFALAVLTGLWNLVEIDFDGLETSYHVTLGLKMLAVGVSGGAAAAHSLTGSTKVRGADRRAGTGGRPGGSVPRRPVGHLRRWVVWPVDWRWVIARRT